MEGFIKTKLTTGFYGNATEVIRDAIRRMQAEESRDMTSDPLRCVVDNRGRNSGVGTQAVFRCLAGPRTSR